MILISGLVAVGIAAGTVIVVQQLDDTTTSSATQASPSELDEVSGSGALAVSPDLLVGDDLMALYGTDNPAFVTAGRSAAIAAPTKQALAPLTSADTAAPSGVVGTTGSATLPSSSPGEFLGAFGDLPATGETMALYGTDNPAFVGARSSAPIAAPTKQALAPPVKDGGG